IRRATCAGKAPRPDGWEGLTATNCLRVCRSLCYYTLYCLLDRENGPRRPRGFRTSGGGFGCGGLLSLPPPLSGSFVADQRARADVHDSRPPLLAPHLVEHVFRDAVCRAEFADRHCERRSANRRRLNAGARLRLTV